MSIGDRVKHARLASGMTQGQLAELVGVKQPAISQIEKGGGASVDTIAGIASATGFAPWFFDLGPLPDLPTGSLRFRKLASSTQRDDDRVRTHVRLALDVLDRHLGEVTLPTLNLRPFDRDAWTEDEIESAAAQAREAVGVGPLDPIPNVIRAVERAGVIVLGYPGEIERHDGVSFWLEGRHPVICFSRGKSGDSQRFTVAHELGHLLLHSRGTRIPGDAEKEAHRFAGAFLVPARAFIDELVAPITLSSFVYAKARWGVSVQALVLRAYALRLIDEKKSASLWKQISSRGWRKAEPVEVPEEYPTVLRSILELTSGGTSPQAIGTATGLPPLQVRQLLASQETPTSTDSNRETLAATIPIDRRG